MSLFLSHKASKIDCLNCLDPQCITMDTNCVTMQNKFKIFRGKNSKNCGGLPLFLSHKASIIDCWLLWLNYLHPRWTQCKVNSAHARFFEAKIVIIVALTWTLFIYFIQKYCMSENTKKML